MAANHFPRNTALKQLRSRLLEWFALYQRDLPWRRNRDPYRIWISEIMLQQTRVAAVIPYFENFCARFPDVARAGGRCGDEVLRLWSGLGYYSRARNLQAAAQQIVARAWRQISEDGKGNSRACAGSVNTPPTRF